MRRRRLLLSLAAGGAVSASPAAAADSPWSNPFAKSWRDAFIEHWRDTRDYTLAVLEAMPEDGFELKPHPAQRTFAAQLMHLAYANVVYFRAFGYGDPPARSEAGDKPDIRAHVAQCFDFVAAVLEKLTEKDVLRTDLQLWPKAPPHSATDVFLRAYMHTAHHRGQLVVYLRVKGITPPAWKFEPAAG